MAASGSSFRQLAPFTIRVPGIDYFAIPTPGQYDVFDYPYSPPMAAMSCVSASGTATLCGYSEYVSPSVPPKKYRRQDLNGSWCDNDYNDGCGGSSIGNRDRQTYGGYYIFSGIDCAETNNQVSSYGLNTGGPTCADVVVSPVAPPGKDFVNPIGALWTVFSETPTHRQWNYPGRCLFDVREVTGNITVDLSIEDTETDAIARASKTPGTECVAYRAARGAGEFSFTFVLVAYDILCSSLLRNHKYRLSYDIITEDYGGGNAVVAPISLLFQADATTKHFIGTLEAASGKQVSIQNIEIEALTAPSSGLSGGGIQTDENHSFREIAPFTPRFVGIDYMAVPAPGNPAGGYGYSYEDVPPTPGCSEPLPVITSQPSDAPDPPNLSGESFSVVATGATEYQWQAASSITPDEWVNIDEFFPYSGTQTPDLVLAGPIIPQEDPYGLYRCRISHGCAVAYSNPVSLHGIFPI